MADRYLELTANDRERLVEFGHRLEPYTDQIIATVTDRLQQVEEVVAILPGGDLAARLRPGLLEYLNALKENQTDQYLQAIGARIRARAEEGLLYEQLIVTLMVLEDQVARFIRELYPLKEDDLAVREAFRKLSHILLATTAQAYLNGKEETIRAQQEAMLALSTPVVEVWEGILALPLIGTIDTGRAKQITQNLLRRIRDTQARIVILDITGVPLVDTRVANHLIKTVRAARLLGARGIIVGISPEVADTLISLDVAFQDISTYFSLRQGLEAAISMLGLKVAPEGVLR